MDMKIIKSEKRVCTCCMEEHEVKTVLLKKKQLLRILKLIMKRLICIVI